MKPLSVLICLTLAGCASVRPLGHDTYTSDSVAPIKAADKYCRERGMVSDPEGYRGHSGEFVFRCVTQ